jgi:signal transduction histidine kinase
MNNHDCEIQNITSETSLDHRINGNRATLVSHYRGALREYLGNRGIESLQSAYELGCIAMRIGLGVFDLARLHEEILAKMLPGDGSREAVVQQARAAETFLLDALSPFEAARRGLPEAYVRLEQFNEILEQRNKALAAILARQRLIKEALRASKERYLKLLEESRSMKKDIRQHSARLLLAQDEERKRVSRELHDEIGQVFAAVNVGLVMLKKQAGRDRSFQKQVVSTQALLEQSLESVHRFARGLRPEMLDLFGPYEAIRSYVRTFAERTGITSTVQSKVDLAGLDKEQGIVLFRVVQESITNISKHAHATRIDIRFRRLPQGICMEIQDNGRSFSVEDKLTRKVVKRLGLLGMQERVRLVHGDFSIESAAGRGTKVRVQLPLGSNNSIALNGNGDKTPGHESGSAVLAKSIL